MSRVRIGTGYIPTLAKFSPKRRFKPGARCWINAAFTSSERRTRPTTSQTTNFAWVPCLERQSFIPTDESCQVAGIAARIMLDDCACELNMSETTRNKSLFSRVGRWLAELILVFVGVYAAFWLNNYQQGKEQAKRRDQILAYLEQRLEDGISKIGRA